MCDVEEREGTSCFLAGMQNMEDAVTANVGTQCERREMEQ
jgi:hypothetical protein